MTPEQRKLVGEAVQVFADGMPAGWKVYEHRGAPYAGRRFEYRNGARALLAAVPARLVTDPKALLYAEPLDVVKTWSGEVSLQFSAGPEVSTTGMHADVHEWAQHRDGWLAMPFVLQEGKSVAEAESIAATLPAAALVLLAAVFDLDPHEGRVHLVKSLVRACVPARAGRS